MGTRPRGFESHSLRHKAPIFRGFFRRNILIAQYLKKVADVPFSTLGEYVDLYGYGNPTEVLIAGKTVRVLPFAHPRQIGSLGAHSEKWFHMHKKWEESR